MNCGGEIGEDHLFCLNCGTPVGYATTSAEAAATATAETAPSYDGPILKVEHLKKYFPIKTNFFGKPIKFLRAVDDINFSLEKGKTIGVVGESGCGKTTLGRTILKLHESSGGKIYFEGDDITDLNRGQMQKYRTDIQLIFQDPYSSLPPRMTVGSIIAEPVRVHNIVPKNEVHSYVLDIMKKCGLKPQHYDRYPHEFSGGQRQRICIARALAVKPKLVICDEPVSALDVSIQAQIINLLKELQQTIGLTYVFISHDLSVVKYITDKILVMYLGNAMEMSGTEELFANPLHPYTQALFSAVPAPDPTAKMNRIVLEGDIPSPANPPAGCKFHTRCAKCMNVCKFKVPEYVEASPDHFVACHLYNKDVMDNLDEYDAEYARLEEEKRRALEEEQAKKSKKKKVAPAATEEAETVEASETTQIVETTEAPTDNHVNSVEPEAPAVEAASEPDEKAEKQSEKTVDEAVDKAEAVGPVEAEPPEKVDDKDDKDDGDNGDKGGEAESAPTEEPTAEQAPKEKKPKASGTASRKKGAGKKNKAKFVDDGRTVFSMEGLNQRSSKPAVELTGKERRAMIRAAFAKYLPAFLGMIGSFSLAALLIYLWLH
ncbi:MAG: dipeptide ABC transporter ATP-binding protein [Clostridiales bacterium]|nr:dipeptide ABC transporter ATP-binding protein [Clostridiales bacterium]